MIKIYQYEKCDSCRKAIKLLDQNGVKYEKISISETPPTKKELEQMLEYVDGDIRKLFNTSGQVYREMGLSDKIRSMTHADCFKILTSNGMLVKRPFILTSKSGMVGYNEETLGKIISRA
jgi:Spx/MgsR family transcriptional regulator